MEMQLISLARLSTKKWKAHAADERGYPLCGVRKMEGVPVIPGTVKLGCERCREILLKRMQKIPEKVLVPTPAVGI